MLPFFFFRFRSGWPIRDVTTETYWGSRAGGGNIGRQSIAGNDRCASKSPTKLVKAFETAGYSTHLDLVVEIVTLAPNLASSAGRN